MCQRKLIFITWFSTFTAYMAVMIDNSFYFHLILFLLRIFFVHLLLGLFVCVYVIICVCSRSRAFSANFQRTHKIHKIEKFPVCGRIAFKNVLHVWQWNMYTKPHYWYWWDIFVLKMVFHKRKFSTFLSKETPTQNYFQKNKSTK